MRISAADAVGEEVHQARVVVPTLHEAELRGSRERLLDLLPAAGDREARVVRGEDEADDDVRAALERALHRLRDPRRPVLHPGEHGQAELALERDARLLGDRVERVVLLDAEPAIALDEIL